MKSVAELFVWTSSDSILCGFTGLQNAHNISLFLRFLKDFCTSTRKINTQISVRPETYSRLSLRSTQQAQLKRVPLFFKQRVKTTCARARGCVLLKCEQTYTFHTSSPSHVSHRHASDECRYIIKQNLCQICQVERLGYYKLQHDEHISATQVKNKSPSSEYEHVPELPVRTFT